VHDILGLIPSLRNLLQPVNRLSPELLSRVVQYIPSVDARDAKSIIPLTHVCRYWRESIVSTPGNWTLISSERFGLMRLSLERCKAAPIKLSLSMWRVGKIPGFSDSIVPYIQNTETLHCHNISTPDQLTQTLPNFPQSMPNLRSLSLSGQLVYWNQSIDPFQPLTLPLTHLSLLYFPLYPAFLSLGTLTDLNLHNYRFNLHLDTLLDFLERNHSLQHVSLGIQFAQSSLRSSRRQVAIGNRLRNLSISSTNVLDNNALISSIVLQTGVDLGISLYDKNAGFDDVLPVVYAARLSNLQSPTFMEHHADKGNLRLLGPNGSFSFRRFDGLGAPFAEFPLLPLTNVRSVCLIQGAREVMESSTNPITFPSSFFPALEMLAIKYETHISHLLSTVFSNPLSSRFLRTLAFLDCIIAEDFIGELTRFASSRKNTTSAWLHHIVIVNSRGNFPSVTSIDALKGCVPVVDVRIGEELPTDLM
jgi:hypothetical protein